MQTFYFKENAVNIGEDICKIAPKNVLIITDFSFYEICGAKKWIESFLLQSTIHYFVDFEPNPKIEDLQKGILFCQDKNFDLIIAVGGGSVIDMAKLIRIYINFDENLENAIKNNITSSSQNSKIPLIAIPTTSGTGSESTHFSVVYVDKKKYSIADESVLPEYAVIIPEFTYKNSEYLTACTGADALCQAIESYWSVKSTDESRGYASEAIRLLNTYLPLALKENREARDKVAYASNLAGRAINISFTTAAHAYSYGFTSYLKIPHGHAVSLSLPYFFSLNINVTEDNCNDPRGADFLKKRMSELAALLNCAVEESPQYLKLFFDALFQKNKIDIEIDDDIWHNIVSSVNIQRLQNNPVKLEAQITKEILK